MAYTPHYLFQFGGDLRGDIWSCGIRFSAVSGPFPELAPEVQQAYANDMGQDVAVWMAGADAGWPAAAKLRYAKFNGIDANGRYIDQTATAVRNWDSNPFPSGSGNSTVPNQVACVISWETPAARGRASQGRIYLPAPTMGINNDTGMWGGGTASPQTVAAAAAAFLTALNNQPGIDPPGLRASVCSKVDGTVRPITAVRVGSVPDTMRSRRNALVETYFRTALA